MAQRAAIVATPQHYTPVSTWKQARYRRILRAELLLTPRRKDAKFKFCMAALFHLRAFES